MNSIYHNDTLKNFNGIKLECGIKNDIITMVIDINDQKALNIIFNIVLKYFLR